MIDWSEDKRCEILSPDVVLDHPRWTSWQRRARAATRALNTILDEVREIAPDANWYLDGTDNLNLMVGEPHDGARPSAQYQRLIDAFRLHAGGGDW